jgi:hypothetical protein
VAATSALRVDSVRQAVSKDRNEELRTWNTRSSYGMLKRRVEAEEVCAQLKKSLLKSCGDGLTQEVEVGRDSWRPGAERAMSGAGPGGDRSPGLVAGVTLAYMVFSPPNLTCTFRAKSEINKLKVGCRPDSFPFHPHCVLRYLCSSRSNPSPSSSSTDGEGCTKHHPCANLGPRWRFFPPRFSIGLRKTNHFPQVRVSLTLFDKL